MTLTDLIEIADGCLLTSGPAPRLPLSGGYAADLMSYVLASSEPNTVLLTGLCTQQVIRTAHLADIAAIVVVRGKQPTPEMIKLAEQEHLPLISSPYGLYELSGRLYQAGLPSLEAKVEV
jgi:predicted transcriptional regulator